MDAWFEQSHLGLMFETEQCRSRVFPHYYDASRWGAGVAVRKQFCYRDFGMPVDAGIKLLLRNTDWQS